MNCENITQKTHCEMIEKFDSGYNDFNKFLKNASSYHCTVRGLIGEHGIIGYCAYRCSSAIIQGEKYPAIEILVFAMDKNYQGKKIGGKTTANVFMEYMLKYFLHIADNYIKAQYVYLHSLDIYKVIRFYKNLGFNGINNSEVLEDVFNDKCVPMYVNLSLLF